MGNGLDLKFIVHAGAFVVQSIAGGHELVGPDVGMAHRLLKTRLAGDGQPAGGFKSATEQPPPDKVQLQKMASDASFARFIAAIQLG